MVTWGTSPQDVAPIDGAVSDPAERSPERRDSMERALKYMDLKPGDRLESVAVDRVFIGSCTNGRIEDLRSAAAVAAGRKVHETRRLGRSGIRLVKAQAEAEGLGIIFKQAKFEWREAGCSMCLGTNGETVGESSGVRRPRTGDSLAGRDATLAPIC